MHSDLLNHSDHGQPDVQPLTQQYLMEIQLCGGEYTCPMMLKHHPTAALKDWWKAVSLHNMASKSLGGTGQKHLIYKVQSKNEDHSFLGEQEAHSLTSAGLYSDTPVKTPFYTEYLHPTTTPSTLEKILPPSVKTLLYIFSESVQICISNTA